MTPYSDLPRSAFWRTAVAAGNPVDLERIWSPKFSLSSDDRFATFGSCFAQHISRALIARGVGWLNSEPAPDLLSAEQRQAYNYGVFSARTGNIYTTTLLLQWVAWACGRAKPPQEIWERDGRFYDPFRPNIEPNGFGSEEEARRSLQQAIDSFRQAIEQASVFVFTLGLTESWYNTRGGYEYPMCPGTVAGTYSSELHSFRNLTFDEVSTSLTDAVSLARTLNPSLRFILTVSPVPLTATYSGQHVLIATNHSKSILRAAAGHVTQNDERVDYFPSYEIINSPTFRSDFFEDNRRNVNATGVDFVMGAFFEGAGGLPHGGEPEASVVDEDSRNRRKAKRKARRARRQRQAEGRDGVKGERRRGRERTTEGGRERRNRRQEAGKAAPASKGSDTVCEEELLAAFGARK